MKQKYKEQETAEMGKHWKHLTPTDRARIDKYLKEGLRVVEIANILRVHRSTIYNEIKRGTCIQMTSEYEFVERYCPEVAERKYRENLKERGPSEKIGSDRALADFIAELIRERGYSPAAAAAEVRKDTTHNFSCTLCEKTIYNYIPKGIFWGVTQKQLPRHGERKRKYEQVTKAVPRSPAGESIEKRPEEINTRQEPFHWEMDCIMGRQKTKPCLLCMTERVTRFEIIFRLPEHTADRVVAALDGLERRIGQEKFRAMFQSITMDNGSEFAKAEMIERSIFGGKRTRTYYCHPYSSWERGSNENQNGLIRRHFTKGCSFEDVTEEDVEQVQDWVNNYPRELLGWGSSREMMEAILAA
ncbi:MAG: IS30 family transposase [Muribaculaceae bacterium]|nr:IS30 family transposase [Muribaculaceae bacterium]